MYDAKTIQRVSIVSDREEVKNTWREIAQRRGFQVHTIGYEDFWEKMLPVMRKSQGDWGVVIDDERIQTHEVGDILVAIFHRMRPEPQVVVLVGDNDTHLDEWVKSDPRIHLHRPSDSLEVSLEHLAGSFVRG